MSTVNANCSNGVSFGIRHTVTAADVSDGTILFDFMSTGVVAGYDLAAAVTVTDSAGLIKSGSDEVITYPSAGAVMVAAGTTCTFVATDIVTVLAQRATAAV